jgi:tetratricopeptide (TPR) repeat protein
MTVIVGSGQGGKKKRLLVIAGVLSVLVLACGAGIGLRLLQDRNDSDSQPRREGSGLSETVDDIQDLRARGDVASANNRIDEALKNPDLEEKDAYYLYIQQGNNFIETQNIPAAIESYLKAEAADETYEIVTLLGDTYRDANNPQKAIEYYRKAIRLIPQSSPVRDDDKTSFEQKITDLGGRP